MELEKTDFLGRLAACTKASEVILVYTDFIEASLDSPSGHPDAAELNDQIRTRWASSTLMMIKTKAWARYEKRQVTGISLRKNTEAKS